MKKRSFALAHATGALQGGKRSTAAFARKSCVVATQFALALMAAEGAYAQQAAAVKGERIEITGTRIPSPNLESTSPVAVIGAEDIKMEGVRNVENLLNNLPQVFANQGANYSNGATGTAHVDLRGLGRERTLVLVNGKRMPPGSPLGVFAADLNQIPAPLIERVEILTGGASAVYGSDAISGVVNFILRDNFQGVQGEVNYSFYMHEQHNPQGVQAVLAARALTNSAQYQIPGDQHKLGESTDANLMLGGNFGGDKGNATVYWGYKKDKPILQKSYDYSECSFTGTATGFICGGSTTGFPGRLIPQSGPNRNTQYTIADAAGNLRPFTAADQFNFAPYNFYQRPSERYTAHVTAHYDITSHIRTYLDFGFHDDHTNSQIAPSGVFGILNTFTGDNPILSAAERAAFGLTSATSTASVIVQRRNIEGGGRQDDLRHTSFRTVGGVKGDIADWDYDIFAQTGKVILQRIYRNDFSLARVGRALDVVRDPGSGAIVCRSFLTGADPNCVPYDMFHLGGVTPAALNYLQTPGVQRGSTSQTVQGATITGDLGRYGLRSPAAKTGVGVALGVERRVDKLETETDVEFTTGDLAGQGGPTIGVAGQVQVKELYTELRIPVIEGRPGADLLSFNGSYRYSDYSTGITTNTYGLGAEYAPIRAVKVRGSYQKAVRAPNVVDLFSAQSLGLYNNDRDPCAGANPVATREQCARTGVTAAQYGTILDNPAGQYNGLFGGNPALGPENAKSATLGVVLQPMRNLSASVDYWQIKVEDVIATLDPTFTLAQCIANGQFCSLIHRDQLGTLWLLPQAFIEANSINLARLKTSGIDVALNYNMPIGRWGTLGANFLGTWLKELKTEPIPGRGEFDCQGLYGSQCGTPNPEKRWRVRLTWSSPWAVDVAATWRHFDSVDHARTSSNPLLAGTVNPVDRTLGERDYFDLAASWAFNRNITIRGGVNNLLDRDPPLSSLVGAGAGNGNTFPQVYDALGRKVFVAAVMRW